MPVQYLATSYSIQAKQTGYVKILILKKEITRDHNKK